MVTRSTLGFPASYATLPPSEVLHYHNKFRAAVPGLTQLQCQIRNSALWHLRAVACFCSLGKARPRVNVAFAAPGRLDLGCLKQTKWARARRGEGTGAAGGQQGAQDFTFLIPLSIGLGGVLFFSAH